MSLIRVVRQNKNELLKMSAVYLGVFYLKGLPQEEEGLPQS